MGTRTGQSGVIVIRPSSIKNRIATIAKIEQIGVVSATTFQKVSACPTRQHIVACPAVQLVIALATVEAVITVATIE